ncbi:unnamed protein product [Polarella glacialis]|uniref:Uncharacterized protein n=1 Tax=Polarella glacialis TaxID=89957 RepID=A0A813KP31_POLGL|nr:unnamed protein product [Polarella glacialis]
MAASLEDAEASCRAAELRSCGLTVLKMPEASLDRATSIFEHIRGDALAAEVDIQDFEPLGGCPLPSWYRRWILPRLPVEQLNFQIGNQTDSDNEDSDDEAQNLRYANAAQLVTLQEMVGDLASVVEPVLRKHFGPSERVVVVNAQFIFGGKLAESDMHRDFCTDCAVSLLTPLYDYSPEEASLYYWPFNQNPEMYASKDGVTRSRRRYAYRKGEAILFSANLYHQTVPFGEPEGGWGERRCRALFCMVLVAAGQLEASPDRHAIMKKLKGPAGGSLRDPITEEWIAASSNSSSDQEGDE